MCVCVDAHMLNHLVCQVPRLPSVAPLFVGVCDWVVISKLIYGGGTSCACRCACVCVSLCLSPGDIMGFSVVRVTRWTAAPMRHSKMGRVPLGKVCVWCAVCVTLCVLCVTLCVCAFIG